MGKIKRKKREKVAAMAEANKSRERGIKAPNNEEVVTKKERKEERKEGIEN